MRKLALWFVALAGAACTLVRPQPSAHVPTPRVVRVAISDDLAPWREWVTRGLRMHARAGVPVALVAADAPHDVLIRHGDDFAPTSAAGLYHRDRAEIELFPAELRGGLQWSSCAAHEISHHFQARHVCRPGERDLPNDPCSPVGRGLAVLNRQIQAPADDCNPFESLCDAASDEWLTLSPLDVLELRRVGALPPRR